MLSTPKIFYNHSSRIICFDNTPTAQNAAIALGKQMACFAGISEIVCLDADDPGSATDTEIARLLKYTGQGEADGFNSNSINQRIDRCLYEICPELENVKTTYKATYEGMNGNKKRHEQTVFLGYRLLTQDEVNQELICDSFVDQRPYLINPIKEDWSPEYSFSDYDAEESESDFEIGTISYLDDSYKSLLDKLVESDSSTYVFLRDGEMIKAGGQAEECVEQFWESVNTSKRNTPYSEVFPYTNTNLRLLRELARNSNRYIRLAVAKYAQRVDVHHLLLQDTDNQIHKIAAERLRQK